MIDEEELRLEEEHFKEYQARITKRINEMKEEHDRQIFHRNMIKAGAAVLAVVVVGVVAFNTIGTRILAPRSVDEAAAAEYSSEETQDVATNQQQKHLQNLPLLRRNTWPLRPLIRGNLVLRL